MKEQEERSAQDFATVLREYRKSQGWSQSTLSEQWCYSFETISAWERGKRFPSRTELPRLARFLDMGVEPLTRLIVAGKNQVRGAASSSMASRIPVDAPYTERHRTLDQSSPPFSQGRLLWTLHLGIENDDLKCFISCPLSNGDTWSIELDPETDFEDIQHVYRLVQDQVVFKARRQKNGGSTGTGKVVPLSLLSHG